MRLLTRSDFDGLACGALLREAGIVDSFKFVHPKDIQDGLVTANEDDVLANIPYIPGCGLWFDHHISEAERVGEVQVPGERRYTPSCARIIFEYYGGAEKFPKMVHMVDEVDRVDSANLTPEDITNPQGWVKLGFLMDPRTGLGRFRDFRISNYELMEMLLDECRFKPIGEILDLPDIKERLELYNEQNELFAEMVKKHSKTYNKVLVTDLRGIDILYTGNRFMPYALYPETSVSLWVVDGRGKMNCPIAVGHSIVNRTSNVRVGSLLLQYGGGGHDRAGTCQVGYEAADAVILELVERINAES